MEERLVISIVGGWVLAILSTLSKYQFKEDLYDTREEYLEARNTLMKRRLFLFPLIILIIAR